MGKERINKGMVIITIITIVTVSLAWIGRVILLKMSEYNFVQSEVIEIAEDDMGKNCTVKSIIYDFGNNEYQVKVVNKKQTLEITYIAKVINAKTKECRIDKFIERKKITPY